MRDHRVETEVGDGHVDVPVAAAGGATLAPHVLREDAPRLDPARDVHAHVAVEWCADVVGPHGRPDADRGSLVPPARIERPRDLALLVEDVAALLDPARDQHVAVDPEEVFAVEPCLFHLLERAHGLRFAHCHARHSND
jgi:hypothetical protein